MDPVVPEDVTARGEDNKEDNHDAEEDERDGTKGDIVKIIVGECS